VRAIVIRYASIGDALQASSPIAELHDAGYEVDLLTSPIGEEVLRHDPHIARIDTGPPKIRDNDYGQYLAETTAGYDLVANLNYSVEGEIALEPINRNYYLPHPVRKSIYGTMNYVERQHLLSQVPFRRNRQWFYETDDEKFDVAAAIQGCLSVGIALSGSHEFKKWRFLPDFCAELLKKYRIRLVLLGALEAQDMLIERDILAEIEAKIGDLDCPGFEIMSMISAPVRMSLTMACQVDVLIGPDTSLLNAAAMRPNRKIIMLTHNTPTNISRDWKNTVSISAELPCAPCLRLRHRKGDCPQIDDKAACTSAISVARVMAETERAIALVSASQSARPEVQRDYLAIRP